jgi:hypothetical protein
MQLPFRCVIAIMKVRQLQRRCKVESLGITVKNHCQVGYVIY